MPRRTPSPVLDLLPSEPSLDVLRARAATCTGWWNPSSILRGDPADREAATDALVRDLAVVAEVLPRPGDAPSERPDDRGGRPDDLRAAVRHRLGVPAGLAADGAGPADDDAGDDQPAVQGRLL